MYPFFPHVLIIEKHFESHFRGKGAEINPLYYYYYESVIKGQVREECYVGERTVRETGHSAFPATGIVGPCIVASAIS